MFDVVASNGLGIIGMDVHVAAEKEVLFEVFAKAGRCVGRVGHENSSRHEHHIGGERNNRERTLVPANAFEPVFVNRNSQVVVCVTPAASSLPVQAQTTSCR